MTTKIEWTEQTWNPTTGCDRISPGCDHCYALTLAGRLKAMGQAKYQNDGDPATSGPGFKLTVHNDTLGAPLRWRKPCRVFVNSMSDLFHADVPASTIAAVFDVMARCPQHTFQILTKRPQSMERLSRTGVFNGDHGPYPLPNVWLGTSIESDRYTFRAKHLRATPAAVRFLSLEPLLGPLPSLDLTDVDWVIVGAESGHGARPMDLGWVREIHHRCVTQGSGACPTCDGDRLIEADSTPGSRVLVPCPACYYPEWDVSTGRKRIPFFFKQDAVNGRKVPLPELDGRVWAEYPS